MTPGNDLGLSEAVYDQLRLIAQHKLTQEKPGHTLQATALVHEAYLRLSQGNSIAVDLGPRFYWAAAEAMRRILIDHARAKAAVKRGGDLGRVERAIRLGGVADLADMQHPEEFEALNRAIERLQKEDPRAGDVVRLRFFAGLTLEDVAQAMGITVRLTRREWEYARAWLSQELSAP